MTPTSPPQTLPKFESSVSLLCWAYNEELLIGGFLERAQALVASCVDDYEIVVIDDCSTDRTNAIVQAAVEANPRIRVIRNAVNRNVGYCLKLAVKSASKQYMFWQTVDWSYDIANLRAFLELLKTHDVVVGVRRAPVQCRVGVFKPLAGLLKLFGVKHITRRSDTLGKAVVSVLNYLLIRVLYRVPVSDFQNVVFYPTKMAQSFTLEANSAFSNPETLIKSYWAGASIAEVPISFIPRSAGEAKGTKFPAIKAAVRDVVGFWWRWVVLGGIEKKTTGRVRRLVPAEWPERSPQPPTP